MLGIIDYLWLIQSIYQLNRVREALKKDPNLEFTQWNLINYTVKTKTLLILLRYLNEINIAKWARSYRKKDDCINIFLDLSYSLECLNKETYRRLNLIFKSLGLSDKEWRYFHKILSRRWRKKL